MAVGTNWTALKLDGEERTAHSTVISAVRLAVPEQARKIYIKVRNELIKRDPAAAARHLEKAIELYPEFVEALSTRSVLERDTNPERALADAKRATELDPNYGEAYIALASAYTSTGKFDDAVRMLDRGITLAPTFWLGYYEMSRVLLCKQDYAAAMGFLQIASSLVPDRVPFLHITRADAFSGLHDDSSAIRELEAYLREDPLGDQISEARQKLTLLKSR